MGSWTDLAKKYGHPTKDWFGSNAETAKTLRNTGKSGFTPVTRDPAGGGANSFNDRLENCQRREFFGFTARELELMEALTPLVLDEMEMGLRNPIHPVLKKANWCNPDGFPKLLAPAPILGDSDGLWDVSLPSIMSTQGLKDSTDRQSSCVGDDVAIFTTRFSCSLESERLSMVLSL